MEVILYLFCFQTWLFDRRINGGKFARVVARRQNKQKEKRPRGGGTGKRQNAQKKMKVLPPPPKMFILESELSKEVKAFDYTVFKLLHVLLRRNFSLVATIMSLHL